MTNARDPAEFGKKHLALMSERRVTNIMAQRDGLNQILIKSQIAANGAAYLGNKLHMQNPVCDMIIAHQIENLSFVNIAHIGQGMQDPIRICGKGLTVRDTVIWFRAAPDSILAEGCHRGKIFYLAQIQRGLYPFGSADFIGADFRHQISPFGYCTIALSVLNL